MLWCLVRGIVFDNVFKGIGEELWENKDFLEVREEVSIVVSLE